MEKPLNVLFVDDDMEFGKINSMGLTALGYNVHFQTSLAGIEDVIKQFSPSIIILDVEIGNENGIERAREIIPRFSSIPLLFISSHTDISFISQGLAVGAVHYLKKPFDIRELDVYIQRFAQQNSNPKVIHIGNYIFYVESRKIFFNNQFLKQLSPLEKNALLLFWKNKNMYVSNEVLSSVLWGKEYGHNLDASIQNLISKLRKVFNKDERVGIKTIRGVGYQLFVL